jgi:hypothetical protein
MAADLTADLDLQTRTAAAQVLRAVDEALQADDAVLAGLEKLGWELGSQGSGAKTDDDGDGDDGGGSLGVLREICAK